MARRTRSFLFDNISKRLVQNTNKTAKEINTRRAANTVANTDILTSKETDTKISTTISNTGINTLSDISIANVVSDQVLQYNANTGNWENETLSLVSSVDGLTDTNLTSLSNGDYLVYSSSGSEWINRSLDLSSYVTDTDIADYSNTAQMNTAIASSNTALKSYVDTNFSNTAQMNTAIASSNTAMKNYVDAEVAGVVNSAPSTLDTLNELAEALGDDPDFATTTATNIGTKLAKSSNLSDLANAATARTNLGLGTAATTASTDYATSAQGTKADTAHGWGNHASAGYGTSNFSGAYADLTGKPSLFSGAYADLTGKPSLFSGAYADLTGKPTIPTNNNQLTNGAGYITTTSANNSLVQLGAIQLYNNEKTTYTAAQGLLIYDQAGDNCLNIYNANLSRWVKIWDDSNDGASSGLDADLLDGQHGSYYSNYNNLSNKPTIPTNNNQLTNGAGYITSTVSGDIDIVGDVKAAGQIRATGWWNTNSSDRSGYAVEIGWSAGEGYLLSYSRTAGAYGAMNYTATSHDFYSGNVRLKAGKYIDLETSAGSVRGYIQATDTNDQHLIIATSGGEDIAFKDGGLSGDSNLIIRGDGNVWVRGSILNGTMAYSQLTGTPTIPTNNNQLTNGAGYITNGANYNVNNAWLRENGDNANVKLYGNSRQMAFRTDGTSEYSTGVGGYPFVWMYGSNASGARKMYLTTGGNLGITGTMTTGGNVNVPSDTGPATSGSWIRNTTAYGYIQIGPANTGHAHIYTDRSNFYFNKTNIQANGNAMWHAGNDGSGSGLDADTLDGLQLNSSTTNNQANAVVRTQANGYIHAGWINSVSGSSGTANRLTRITASYDAYLRYLTVKDFKVQIGESYKNDFSRSVDYTTDSNYWVGSFGKNGYNANQTFHAGSGFFDIWSGSNYPSGTSHIHGFNALHYTVGSISGNTGNAYGWQMAAQYNQDSGPWWRRCSAGSFTSWRKIWHDSNDGSGSGLDADLLDGYHLTTTDRNNQANRVVRTQANGRIYGGQFYANDWFRAESTSGLYFQSYGGGWNMTDTSWIRAYNGKAIYATNTIATSANICAYYSDERLKTITGHIDNALDKVLSLDGFYYVENELAKELGYNNDKQQVGVSAQKVQAVLPEAVELAPVDYETGEHDGIITSKSGENYLTVDYAKMVPLLIEAIKEQQKQIEELKEKIK